MDLSLEALLKVYGPMGLLAGLLILIIWRALLPRLDKQQQENQAILSATLEDARKERDRERMESRQEREEWRKLIEGQANRFLESSKIRDEITQKGFNEVLGELRSPRRK